MQQSSAETSHALSLHAFREAMPEVSVTLLEEWRTLVLVVLLSPNPSVQF